MNIKQDWLISFLLACGIHAIVLFSLGLAITESAEFGMALGQNSVEVNLVAAPAVPAEETPRQELAPTQPEPPKEEEMVMPEPVKETPPPPVVPPPEKPKLLVQVEPNKIKGDGSSAVPGADATTLQSTGGVEAKPGYLKNPPPSYPERARQLGQEGVVMLTVEVSASGNPGSVEIKQSSQFQLLDDAAVKAVKRWKFRPAQMGGIPVASQVDVPVRFQLK